MQTDIQMPFSDPISMLTLSYTLSAHRLWKDGLPVSCLHWPQLWKTKLLWLGGRERILSLPGAHKGQHPSKGPGQTEEGMMAT